MRSLDEQMEEISRRADMQRNKSHKRSVLRYSVLSACVSVCLIIAVANMLSSLNLDENELIQSYYGAMLVGSSVVGFVIIVLLAFALGVCVTLLGIKLRGGKGKRDKHDR